MYVIIIIIIIVCVCNVGRRQYKRQYSQSGRQQNTQRPMIVDKTVAATPKMLRGDAGLYTDDDNDYTRGGGACVVHRPLPSLPRRMDGSWAAKSVRSDASGSDASLHWDTADDVTTGVDVDDLPQPPVHARAVRCRSVAAGSGDYSSTGRGDDSGGRQSVGGVIGYRTMPRPCVQHGDEINQRHLLAQQLRRQSRPDNVRKYANISDHSVDV